MINERWSRGVLFAVVSSMLAVGAGAGEPLSDAVELEKSGQLAEAFTAYLDIPGMAHAAARIGRSNAKRYLELYEDDWKAGANASRWLVAGDLFLSMGGDGAALDAYRAAAKCFSEAPPNNEMPHFAGIDYPVDYQTHGSREEGRHAAPHRPLHPLQIGPGSHRDNWLIRRFISLKADDDTAAEFARVWEWHRFRTRPYVSSRSDLQARASQATQIRMMQQQLKVPVAARPSDAEKQYALVTPAGFDRYGLQFALDYAHLLKRADKQDQSLDVLFEALSAIDLDRNPNSPRTGTGRIQWLTQADADAYPRRAPGGQRFHPFGTPVGISRKAFIRLAYGAFKSADASPALATRLKHAATRTDDPLQAARIRHLLAPIRLQASDKQGALAAELAYLDTPELGFSEWTRACRKGMIYEALGMNAEAAAAYERGLKLPATPQQLPDAEEEAHQSMQMSSMPIQLFRRGLTAPGIDLKTKLIRLYTALGEDEKLLRLSLLQFGDNPALLTNTKRLKLVRQRYRDAGRDEEFITWATQQIESVKAGEVKVDPHVALLHLALACDNLPLAAEKAALVSTRNASIAAATQWAELFRQREDQSFALYLAALKACKTNDPRIRLALIEWEGGLGNSPQALEILAKILALENASLFGFGKGSRNQTGFRNYFDIGYRVMRGYQASGDMPAFNALGLRIARGAMPFGKWWQQGEESVQFRDANEWPEDLNSCLSLLVQYADAATLATLTTTWKTLPDHPARRQLSRRCNQGQAPSPPPRGNWAGVPEGVNLLVSNENVLSVIASEDRIYAGMPWGLAVYNHEGDLLTRLPLGRAVQALLYHRNVLWCATPTGVLRVDPKEWSVSQLPTDTDIERPDLDRTAFNRGTWTLAADGDAIWIGTRRNIQHYNVRTHTLRVFSKQELGVQSHLDWNRFLVTKKYVWAEGSGMLLRYDRGTASWSKPHSASRDRNARPVGLIGFHDGTLWGHVWLNDALRDRPCKIDPDTLAVTPVLLDDALPAGNRCINGPFTIYGSWNGTPVFGVGSPRYYYDKQFTTLRELPQLENGSQVPFDTLIPTGLAGGTLRVGSGGIQCVNDMTHDLKPIPGMRLRSGRWTLLRLDAETLVLGARTERSPRYQYPREDWPEGHETGDNEGGLYLLKESADGARVIPRRISQKPAADSILSDTVFNFLPPEEGQPGWLCTARGVVTLTESLQVGASYTRADGVGNNRIVEALRAGPHAYFASGWGDHGGGLLRYDPATRVFTSFGVADGLATSKLAGLQHKGALIELTYDCEYGRGAEYRYRRFPAADFDPATGRVSVNGKPHYSGREDAAKGFAHALIQTRQERLPAPLLGGFILAEHEFEGKRVLCTTRGVVVADGQWVTPTVTVLTPNVAIDPTIAQIQAAKQTQIRSLTPEQLQLYVEGDNPYLAARAVATLTGRIVKEPELLPIVAMCLKSPLMRTRSTALYVLTRSPDPAVMPFLRQAQKDASPYIRDVASIALLARGQRPDAETISRLLEGAGHHGNFPFDVTSSVGCQAELGLVYHALAPWAEPADFTNMLRRPYVRDDAPTLYRDLGASLRKHPAAAQLLLEANNHDSSRKQVRFATRALAGAGDEILPVLQQALQSDDRIVRSNAARACGLMGATSTIPALLAALDLESGLSRASIVWALGELAAVEAVPHLEKLYIQAMADAKRRGGSGFRFAQQRAVVQNQYAALTNLDTPAATLSELTRTSVDPPVDPQRNEELLKPRHILKAIADIGAVNCQPFYRSLAGSGDTDSRLQAAIHLAECPPSESEQHRVILRGMLGDSQPRVEIAAASSLLLLGDPTPTGANRLHRYLDSEKPRNIGLALEQLRRLKGSAAMTPFLQRLQVLAEDDPTSRLNRHVRRQARELAESLTLKKTE